LHQGHYFQHFIQRAKTARAHHQSICFLGEKQFAGKEKVKRQNIGRAIDGGVGPLLERQGDIEPQTVSQACTFMGGSHDASAAAGNDHHVGLGQHAAHFPCQGIERVFYRGSGRAEDRDFATALELLQGAKGFFQFANGLQGDLGIPAIKVVMGHAQYGQQHLAVKRPVRAVGCNPLQLLVHFLCKLKTLLLEKQRQGVIGLIRHVFLLLRNILENAAT